MRSSAATAGNSRAGRASRPTSATPAAAVASTRCTGNFAGYILDVVGPDSIAGCTRGATVTFRVDGVPVAETAVNDRPVDGDARPDACDADSDSVCLDADADRTTNRPRRELP